MTRRNELDALRGIFLLVMAGTHLPTVLNPYANQPLGFVSAAEGFVFLSAFLVGSIYSPLLLARGVAYVRGRLLKRARKLYGYHLMLLLFVFTVVLGVAELTGVRSLHDYLRPLFLHPVWAVLGSPFFLYQPPLLDILPMYIAFLALSPALLAFASRRGWGLILGGSAALWLFAQLGGGRLLYEGIASMGMPLSRPALGAFNWYGWQLVWVSGLWLGARQHRATAPSRASSAAPWRGALGIAAAVAVSVFFLLWRHHVDGLLSSLNAGWAPFDKWKLGPLRVVNCVALGWVVNAGLLPALRWLRPRLLELLGRNSLQVFSAHIPVCVLGDGLLGHNATPPNGAEQLVLIALILAVMFWVGWRSDLANRKPAASGARAGAAPGEAVPVRASLREREREHRR